MKLKRLSMALKNLWSDEDLLWSSYLIALDNEYITECYELSKALNHTNRHQLTKWLNDTKSSRQRVHSTNVNLSQIEKTKLLVVEDPTFDVYEGVLNVFGIPSISYVQLYYAIRFGVCLVDEVEPSNNWTDYNYYMQKNNSTKPKMLTLHPRYYYENRKEFSEEIKTINFDEESVVYSSNNELYPIDVTNLKPDDSMNDSKENFKYSLSWALRTISTAKLIKKYSKSENYHPLILPEHKTYVDNILSLDSLYQETFINLSKLTQYLDNERANMDNKMIEEYNNKIESFSNKVNSFLNDYNDLTDNIIEFNDGLGRNKTRQKHKNFLLQFD